MTLRITLLVLVTGLFAMIWTHDQPSPNASLLARKHSKPLLAKKVKKRVAAEANTRGTALRSESTEPTILPALIAPIRRSLNGDRLSKIQARWDMAVERTSPYLMRAGGEWAKRQLAISSRQLGAWLSAKMKRPASPRRIAVKPITLQQQKMPRETEIPLPEGIVPGEYRLVSNTGIVRPLILTLEDLQINRDADAEFVPQDVYESTGENCRWFFIRVLSNPAATVPAIAERGHHVTLPAIAELSPERLERQASQIIVSAGQKVAQNLARIALGSE